MKIFLPLVIFFYSFIAFSQDTILLKGQLIFSSFNTSAINIVNVSTHQGTINNKKGEFEIEVSLGDELLFSSVQYEPYRVVITQEIMDKRWIRVELAPGVNELEAVTISSIDLSGSLKTDLNSVGLKPYYNNTSFGVPKPAPKLTVEERRLHTASSGGPVGLLINVISGRLKKLKKLKEFAELDKLIEEARNSMNTDFFVSECGVPEEYITSFLYFCALDANFKKEIQKNDKLDLLKYFKNKAKLFKKEYLPKEQ